MSLLLLAPRLRRPWAVWLAVLVAACSALAPTLSHALAHANAPLGFVICTSSNKLPLAADSPAGPQSAKSFDHCQFCLHSADRVAPPPHPLPYLFLGSGGQQEATARPSPPRLTLADEVAMCRLQARAGCVARLCQEMSDGRRNKM